MRTKICDTKVAVIFFLLLSGLMGNTALAQQHTVSGTVTNTQTGNPLVGVNILIKGTTTGTTTDADGNYSLSVSSLQDTLRFSYIGYKTKTVPIEGQTTINVSLQSKAIVGQELVVVGYGTQTKEDVTGSITTVSTDALSKSPSTTNIISALQTSAAGLTLTSLNHKPGADQSFLIRGSNSISASSRPLIVIDGIPYNGSISSINPNNIKSVSILKDVSAAAIYGSRGANGVILIHTKDGRKGEMNITYSGNFGIQKVSHRIDMLNPKEFLEMRKDFEVDRGANPNDLSIKDLLYPRAWKNYKKDVVHDWQDLIFRRGYQTQHHLSISGGSKKTQYYTSIGYNYNKGIVEGSSANRIGFLVNLDHSITEWLNVGTKVKLSQESSKNLLGSIRNALRLSPYGGFKKEDGSYYYYPQFPDTFYENPFSNINQIKDGHRRQAFLNFNTKILFPFVDGLSYDFRFGFTLDAVQSDSYYGRNTLTGSLENGMASVYNSHAQSWIAENILTYKTNFLDKHNIEITALFSRQHQQNESNSMTGRGFVTDGLEYHAIELALSEDFDRDTYYQESNMISYMGRVNYSYDNRYYLTLTARRDGYSGFGRNHKFGFFPSAAIAWNISNESFFNVEQVNHLKLRVSYGVSGNQAISPYQTLDFLDMKSYIYGDGGPTALGVIKGQSGNPNLKWESTRMLNIGIDFGLYNNRIKGSLNYFHSLTYDLLMPRTIPVMNQGTESILDNVGKLENYGIELTLSTINISNSDFLWSTDFNFSISRQSIVELYGSKEDDIANEWFIGEPADVYFGYLKAGIWQKDDDIVHSAQPEAQPGDIRFKDINGDGEITPADRSIIGKARPDFTASMTNKFSYKNFELSFVILWIQGGFENASQILNPERYLLMKHANYIDVNYWTPNNPSNAYPRLGWSNNLNVSFYQNQSFIKLKNVTIAYRLPNTKSFGLSNARIYLNARNFFTVTDWIGFDPYATGAYPSATTYMLGIEFTL